MQPTLGLNIISVCGRICCHLVAGRVLDQAVGLSGKESATTALHDTILLGGFLLAKGHRRLIASTIALFHTLKHGVDRRRVRRRRLAFGLWRGSRSAQWAAWSR